MSTLNVTNIANPNGTTAMTIDNSGRVLQPTKPCFFAYMSSGTVTAWSTNTSKTPLNTTLVNIGNCWSTSNYEFTAPVTGTYSINWGLHFKTQTNVDIYNASRVFKEK